MPLNEANVRLAELDNHARSHGGSAFVVTGPNWDLCLRTKRKLDPESPRAKRLNELLVTLVESVDREMSTGQAQWCDPQTLANLANPTVPEVIAVGLRLKAEPGH